MFREIANRNKPYFRKEPSCYAMRYGFKKGGPIKIGFSDQVRRRYQNLRGIRHPLIILMVIPGTFALEKILHRAFEPINIKFGSALGEEMDLGEKEKEWFQSEDKEQQKAIEKLIKRIHKYDRIREWFVSEVTMRPPPLERKEWDKRLEEWIEKSEELKEQKVDK